MTTTEAQKKRDEIIEAREGRLDVVIRAAQSALKTAFLVNSGGAIAILGFFGQAIQTETPSPAAPYLAKALLILGIGTALAGLATGLSFLAQYAYFIRKSNPKLGKRAPMLTKINIYLVLASLTCFIVASFVAYRGFCRISQPTGMARTPASNALIAKPKS